MSNISITNEDNMELMARYPDNYFELAIVDPPYGIDINSSGTHFKEKYDIKEWDKSTPSTEYFNELKRVSKNQIVWGGNYFLDRLGNCKCFIIWDKKIAEDMSFAMCEMAWTSFKNGAKIYKNTATQINRIHPTQKPIKLYEWLLMRYAKEGDKILDTHLGSGSIALACHNLKFDLTACELDKDYYDASLKRLHNHQSQLTMF
jgi:site-specific DNA-methyltransferase (adenine-specific)